MKEVILITGANQGIGYYLVRQLLEDGNYVSVLDIEVNHLIDLKKQFPNQLLYTLTNICNQEDIHKGVLETMKKFERIDIAIQNACLCTFDSEEESDLSLYQKVMDTNYFGCLRLCKEVLPIMKKQNKGKIIFTSSGVGVTGFGNISPYASSKGAIESLAKCLAIENQDKNITFHLFHPPLTQTNSSSGLPIPKEFMASAKKVGVGLAKHINSNRFVICHSLSQSIQMKLCYRHPLYMGRMMWKMTNRKKENI